MKIPVLLLVILAAAAGYLFGTESGRSQKDQLVGRIKRDGDDLADDLADAADAAGDAVADATA